MVSQRCSSHDPRTRVNYLPWQMDFAGVIKSKHLEMMRLTWIIQIGPIYSHESLKAEDLSHLRIEREIKIEEGSERDGIALLALKMEEGGHKSRNVLAFKSWKGQGRRLP